MIVLIKPLLMGLSTQVRRLLCSVSCRRDGTSICFRTTNNDDFFVWFVVVCL